MSILEEISIPKDNVNDEVVLIKTIYVKDNEEVGPDTLLLDYETSKVNIEIKSDITGFVKLLCSEGDTIEIGENVIIILDKKESNLIISSKTHDSEQTFSKNALRKLDELKMAKSLFKNENLITEKKVLDYYNQQSRENNNGDNEILPMTSANQSMLNMVLWQKENTVPAYLEILTDQSPWEAYAQELMNRHNLIFNPLLGVLAYKLVKMAKKRPEINSYCDGHNIIIYNSVNLGFTVEVKNKLYIVVVRNADKMNEVTFVKNLFNLEKKAYSDKLNIDETRGATITFTSLSKANVIRHIPILPFSTGLIVAHSVSSIFEIKNKVTKPIVVGATYDHRYLNGGVVATILNDMVEL